MACRNLRIIGTSRFTEYRDINLYLPQRQPNVPATPATPATRHAGIRAGWGRGDWRAAGGRGPVCGTKPIWGAGVSGVGGNGVGAGPGGSGADGGVRPPGVGTKPI